MVTIKREIDDAEFWSTIFGSGWESFGSHWRHEKWYEGDWETPGKVRLGIEDPEDYDKTIYKIIDLPALVAAYELAWSSNDPGFPYPHEGIDRSYLDLDNLDAVGSDGILQCAVLGRVVYG